MEYFDIVDAKGEPTGKTVERKEAHRLGIPHRTSHVWIVRNVNNKIQILLQKRCDTKDSFPGCYDISSAGHIPAGDDYEVSALRELDEELGLKVKEEQLIDCGIYHLDVDTVFYGEEFHDRQYSKVFLLWIDLEENQFVVQKEEIDSVKWFDFQECKKAVKENNIKHCIDLKELELIEKYL